MPAKFHVIIPARYHSTRLPAKALAKIGDNTMIERVCAQAAKSGAQSITVATDHQEIIETVLKAGYSAVMTRDDHPSGSDRVYQAAELIGLKDSDIIVNVQGDEPFIPSQNINQVASLLEKPDVQMSTLCAKITDSVEIMDANVVKVIFNIHGNAIYFSRSVIPFNRDQPVQATDSISNSYFRHIGIYAYRKNFLNQYISWPQSCLEKIESLEQLRVIENGYNISVGCLSEIPPAGIDTPHDLAMARKYVQSQG